MAKRLYEQRPTILFNRKKQANAAPGVGAAAVVTPARWAHFTIHPEGEHAAHPGE